MVAMARNPTQRLKVPHETWRNVGKTGKFQAVLCLSFVACRCTDRSPIGMALHVSLQPFISQTPLVSWRASAKTFI
jgi:hypothetical protein